MFFLPSAFMYYYDNPKGMLPTWLINWAAQQRLAHDVLNNLPIAIYYSGNSMTFKA